jgi:hypothetical protein
MDHALMIEYLRSQRRRHDAARRGLAMATLVALLLLLRWTYECPAIWRPNRVA